MKHNDVKWRNIGLDNNKNVVKSNDDDWVEEAIQGLESRIGGEEMFNEVKIIEDYWSKLKKQGGNKGLKGKEKE